MPNPLERGSVLLGTWFNGFTDTLVNIWENSADRLGIQHRPHLGTVPLDGKVCIVTGANAGIGLATAELLAARGAHVVMACRSLERGNAAAQQLLQRVTPLPGCQPPRVEVQQVDLASLASVRAFCAAFNARRMPLHLLVCNAGIMSPAQRLTTPDGLEMQFQCNFLSHWLMAQQLLAEQRTRRARQGTAPEQASARQPARGPSPGGAAGQRRLPGLRGAGSALAEVGSGGGGTEFGLRDDGTRVVMVSSLTHRAGILNWQDMQSEASYDPFTSYGLSKLANALTAVELQRRFNRHSAPDSTPRRQPAPSAEGSRGLRQPGWGADSAVAVHPGLVDTYLANNFFKNQGIVEVLPASRAVLSQLVDWVGPLAMKSPANSARVVAYAALAPASQVAGEYVADSRVVGAAPAVNDKALAEQLWTLAERLTGQTTHESMR